jgi:hypothetical protein
MGTEIALGKVRAHFFLKSCTLRSVIFVSLFCLFNLMSTHVILFVAIGATNSDYLLTPCSRALLEKLTGSQLVKFPTFYGDRRFTTAFTSALHMSLSRARSIQSMPHPTFRIPILILFSHLRQGLQCCFFPSGFPTKTLYIPFLSPLRATCPAHIILFYLITRIIFG